MAALGVGGFGIWAKSASNARLTKTFVAHTVDFPVPFPLSDAEIEALRAEKTAVSAAMTPPASPGAPPVDPLAGVDLAAIALERARESGKHLVLGRYACSECHGKDFSGGKMIDDPMFGVIQGPNLTGGAGSHVAGWTVADWDRQVRHGIRKDGTAAIMPSKDYLSMSDHELSDILAYLQSFPAVDTAEAERRLGPVGTVLVAMGALELSAEIHPDHDHVHAVEAPPTAVTVEFGAHLAKACSGCHREAFDGGPIPGGAPSWPPAANLTNGPDGLAGWTYADFLRAMREATSKDGRKLASPMAEMTGLASQMTDVELEAMWAYLSTVPGRPDGT